MPDVHVFACVVFYWIALVAPIHSLGPLVAPNVVSTGSHCVERQWHFSTLLGWNAFFFAGFFRRFHRDRGRWCHGKGSGCSGCSGCHGGSDTTSVNGVAQRCGDHRTFQFFFNRGFFFLGTLSSFFGACVQVVRRGIFKVLGRDGRHVLKTKGTLTDGKQIAVAKDVGGVGGGQMVGFVDDRGVGFGQCFEGGSESTSFLIERDMGVATGDGGQLYANGVFRFAAQKEKKKEQSGDMVRLPTKRCWNTYRPKVTPSDMVRWFGTTGRAGPSWPLRLMTTICASMFWGNTV